MDEPKTQFDRFYLRIRHHPIVASLIILGTIVIALSTFTDATITLWDLVITDTRPDINGMWKAEVTYDWQNARYSETFTFSGDGEEVYGTASFLGMKRGIVEGKVKKNKLQFITIIKEFLGNGNTTKDVVRSYQGKILGDEITFVMQTEAGISVHIPIEFTARRNPVDP